MAFTAYLPFRVLAHPANDMVVAACWFNTDEVVHINETARSTTTVGAGGLYWSGIRTRETLAGLPRYQRGGFSHSPTQPLHGG